jgi:hypothetical protein
MKLGESPADALRRIRAGREDVIARMLSGAPLPSKFSQDLQREENWYDGTKSFLPPPEFWGRHPGFKTYQK